MFSEVYGWFNRPSNRLKVCGGTLRASVWQGLSLPLTPFPTCSSVGHFSQSATGNRPCLASYLQLELLFLEELWRSVGSLTSSVGTVCLGEITGAVVELQVLLFEAGIYQLDFNAPIRAVAGFVRRRIGHEILLP